MILRIVFSAWITVTSANAAPFSFDDLSRILNEKSPRTLEAALPLLPPDFRRDAVLMRRSRSLQYGSPEEPRAILSNSDGSFVLSFNGDGDSMGGGTFEVMQYHRATHHFEFAEIEFANGKKPVVKHNATSCGGCHGQEGDLHPVWESFKNWPGAYGEADDRIEPLFERRDFLAFLKAAPKSSRYGALVDLEKTHGTLDASGRLAGRPNATLLRKLMLLNFDRLADLLVSNPIYAKNRYALLGTLECASTPKLAASFFPDLPSPPENLLGFEENADPNSGDSAIAFYWLATKRGYEPFASWSMALGDQGNKVGARLPDPNREFGTATEEFVRAIAARDPVVRPLVGPNGRKKTDCDDLSALALHDEGQSTGRPSSTD